MNEEVRKKFGIEEGKPNDWFENLYSQTNEEGEGVPWANMSPHPIFKDWIDKNPIEGVGKKALVVGCGMGDDAIELESMGFAVTAFDVSKSAVDLCKKRFPDSQVEFVQADLIEGVPGWTGRYDFILEIFTIQALPPKYEEKLIENLAAFVSENGQLMVITEIQHETRTYEKGPPWLLNNDYVQRFEKQGLSQKFQSIDHRPEMGDELHLTIFERPSK